MRVFMYVRVSTDGQADSRLGLEAQRESVERECALRGWPIVGVFPDAESARSLKRPELAKALELLASGAADVLMVSKMDRCTRSLKDWCDLAERSQREGWALLALDSPADPTTPHGEAMVAVQVVFSQLERRLIGQRTKEALAVKRASGIKLGRPRLLPDDVRARILQMREEDGFSFGRIAAVLNADGVQTAQGGKRWYPASVRGIVLAG